MIGIYDMQSKLVKEGKRDPQSLKLTYEEEAQRGQTGSCCS